MTARRRATDEVLEFDKGRIGKLAPVRLDLNDIAKGYGVDRVAETLQEPGITGGLVGIDGKIGVIGTRPDGEALTEMGRTDGCSGGFVKGSPLRGGTARRRAPKAHQKSSCNEAATAQFLNPLAWAPGVKSTF